MADIRRAKIYKLYCDDGHYYFGSTIAHYLCKRIAGHKSDGQKESFKHNKLHSHINRIGWDRVKIILVEEIDYTTKDDLRRKENEYIVKALADPLCLNHNRAIVTEEERHVQWRKGKDKLITERAVLETCECGMVVTHGRMAKHKTTAKHREALTSL